jgi:hypothetical protein
LIEHSSYAARTVLHTTENAEAAYGAGGRTTRPLFALIPIGVALAVALAMLAEGLQVMTSAGDTGAAGARIAQAAAPPSKTS